MTAVDQIMWSDLTSYGGVMSHRSHGYPHSLNISFLHTFESGPSSSLALDPPPKAASVNTRHLSTSDFPLIEQSLRGSGWMPPA